MSKRGGLLRVPAGDHVIAAPLRLHSGVHLAGEGPSSRLLQMGAGPILAAAATRGVTVSGLALVGRPDGTAEPDAALFVAHDCAHLDLRGLVVVEAPARALVLEACSGAISNCIVERAGTVAIFSLDARGLRIADNHIRDCGDNGILVWTTASRDDGTIVTGNRIERIGARSAGTGQNGNGINVFRARNVSVSGNTIVDCAYSAIRANATSNVRIDGNTALRCGEVAVYVEFGFEGAVISSNIVDGAAAGISATNFNEGGRLVVIQGNLVRNTHVRASEPVDKRGEGIVVEADASVVGNVLENVATTGIAVGWGPYLRDVVVSANVVRDTTVGIGVETSDGAGSALVSGNRIVRARRASILATRHGAAAGVDLATPGVRVPPNIQVSGNSIG
jgi:uncharacterized secreted repeat protein (TIGR03808 family)